MKTIHFIETSVPLITDASLFKEVPVNDQNYD